MTTPTRGGPGGTVDLPGDHGNFLDSSDVEATGVTEAADRLRGLLDSSPP
jgi:hypothetical protein